ncbi:MAG: lytic transglycosylase domain-containing protein [Acidobacteria bacterium]|nr:lytic transglycosylase domain-containing protein [Acidobacteriota bacterium]MCI0718061.1 lytic transglycosylase domain-containing protein [Acidobacteriota bacterium]
MKVWGIPISFWLMACCMTVEGEQAPDVEVRVRAVSTYYAQHYARLYCVPIELVEAIIEVESGWRPEAMSSKGAVGLMQLMPATAQRFQVRNRYNIEQNIRGGVSYLAVLYKLFKGDCVWLRLPTWQVKKESGRENWLIPILRCSVTSAKSPASIGRRDK